MGKRKLQQASGKSVEGFGQAVYVRRRAKGASAVRVQAVKFIGLRMWNDCPLVRSYLVGSLVNQAFTRSQSLSSHIPFF